MLTLDLTNLERSDIKYTFGTFPDGEPFVKLGEINRRHSIRIVTRITNPTELFRLMQVCNVLKRHGVSYTLYIPYLMGTRMDRVMSFQEPFTLEVIAECINSLGASWVWVESPHSERTLRLIKNCSERGFPFDLESYDYICYPDKGAAERYDYLLEDTRDLLFCTKVRNPETGELSGFSITNPEVYQGEGKSVCVVDDLCDGGGTFVGIAQKLKELDPTMDLTIKVTHAIQASGIDKLCQHYDHVEITNSYAEWQEKPRLKVLDVCSV